MSKKQTIVKNLNSIQNFGAMDILCTDKTGTLTQNRMTVSQMLMQDEDSALLDEAIACNTTAFLNESRTEGLGNPTEVALLLWMQGRGSDYMKVRQGAEEVARLPFSSERKYMATIVDSSVLGRKVVYVKGRRNRFWDFAGGYRKSKLPGIMPG